MFNDIHNKTNGMIPGILPFLNAMNQASNIKKEYSGQLNAIMNSGLVPLIEKNAMANDIKNIAGRIIIPPYLQQLQEARSAMRGVILPINLIRIAETVVSFYHDDVDEDEEEEIIKTDSKIITEIFAPEDKSKPQHDNSTIILLSPINDRVLKYLLENPEAFYHLESGEFEEVMTQIYCKLGYDVERTQATRDGGRDIILRKPSLLGDFIYYVECKKYAPKRPIGVGIVRGMVGTINTDKVNGGIIATTSYFTRDARNFILNNNLEYQIQMHDFEKIKKLLRNVV